MAIINWRLALIVFAIIPIMVYIAIQFRKKILVEYRVSRRPMCIGRTKNLEM
jgi:ABC-type multidrug transport system fused ATPase/permease subunit